MNDQDRSEDFTESFVAGWITPDQRQKSLLRMLLYARQRRRRQQVTASVLSAVLLVGLALKLFVKTEAPDPKAIASPIVGAATKPRFIPGTPIRILSDDELFALFPDRSIGVIEDSDGPRLVFLDEEDVENLR